MIEVVRRIAVQAHVRETFSNCLRQITFHFNSCQKNTALLCIAVLYSAERTIRCSAVPRRSNRAYWRGGGRWRSRQRCSGEQLRAQRRLFQHKRNSSFVQQHNPKYPSTAGSHQAPCHCRADGLPRQRRLSHPPAGWETHRQQDPHRNRERTIVKSSPTK